MVAEAVLPFLSSAVMVIISWTDMAASLLIIKEKLAELVDADADFPEKLELLKPASPEVVLQLAERE